VEQLLQFDVLGLGLLQDGNVGIGVFPEGEKILVRSFRLGGVTGKRVGPAQLQVGQCADELVGDDAGVVENLLKLDSSGGALLSLLDTLRPAGRRGKD